MLVLAPVLLLLSQGAGPLSATPSRGPALDVLVVVLDDLSYEAAQAFPMPTLDFLAASGARFERAYAMPNCSPARYGALFGRWPRRGGVGSTIDPLDPAASPAPPPRRGLLSLPEVFKARGYDTACIGKWHLGNAGLGEGPDMAPHVQGFDDYLAGQAVGAGAHGESHYLWRRTDNGVVSEGITQYTGDAQRDAFMEWWGAHAGRPRFAWLAFNPPHPPQDPPPGSSGGGSERERYGEACSYVDRLLGDCLTVVDLSRTVLLVIGDNGTPRGARPEGTPLNRWKGSTFEGGVRVPMVLHGPGVLAGDWSFLVSIVDMPRILFDALGWRDLPPGTFEDARPLGQRSWLLVERFEDPLVDDVAIVEARWKYRLLNGFETFLDLQEDPDELAPLALDDPAITPHVERLRGLAAGLPLRGAF